MRAFNKFLRKYSTRQGKQSLVAGGALPLDVTGFTATANGATAMDLAWTNPAGQEANSQVLIERSEGDALNFAPIAVVPAADEAYADSGLTTATEYFYRISTLDVAPDLSGPQASDTTA